jgi:hypothetical protein
VQGKRLYVVVMDNVSKNIRFKAQVLKCRPPYKLKLLILSPPLSLLRANIEHVE